MGGTEQKLTGPNFKNRIPMNSLHSEQRILGHADVDAVLLIPENEPVHSVLTLSR